MSGKLLRKDKSDSNELAEGAIAFNNIISFDTLGAILGIFFPICSVAYILIKQYSTNFWLGVAILALATFFSMWIVFFAFAYANRKKKAKKHLEDDKKELVEQLIFCRNCSLSKINNGLEYRKLFTHKEILNFEEKLVEDPEPAKTVALIYTSELSTILRRKEKMIYNIAKGAKYYIVYFRKPSESVISELNELNNKNLILINANDYPDLFNSMDAQFMSFADFEMIILVDSTRNYKQGFFSVDNITKNTVIRTHDSECHEPCNRGKEYQEPLYKALDDDKAGLFFDDFESLMKGDDLHE